MSWKTFNIFTLLIYGDRYWNFNYFDWFPKVCIKSKQLNSTTLFLTKKYLELRWGKKFRIWKWQYEDEVNFYHDREVTIYMFGKMMLKWAYYGRGIIPNMYCKRIRIKQQDIYWYIKLMSFLILFLIYDNALELMKLLTPPSSCFAAFKH